MLDKYILDEDGLPHREPDLLAWAHWFEACGRQRIVAQDEVFPGVTVSTVFLGIDHNWSGKGPAILWESMVFAPNGYPLADEQQRYSSLADARAGHVVLIRHVRAIGEHKESP
jgi:hypothetical protein